VTKYEATVSADMSGYTSSVQQSIALTNQFAAANEGLIGFIGRNGTRAIMQFTDTMGMQQKMMKANVAEASRYQQVLGGVSARARAAGQSVDAVQASTRAVARRLTGDINSAAALVQDIQTAGETRTANIEKQAKVITQLSAATGGSGTGIAANLRTMLRSYGSDTSAGNIEALGDSLVGVTSKFGASADAVADFSKNIAPFAKQLGIGETAVIGFSTAFAKQGESGARSARVFSQVLSDIDAAVRDGTPVLGKYADAAGMTTKAFQDLVDTDAGEAVIRFAEQIGKGGPKAVRALESLGLGSVLEQRALSALGSSGQIRESIKASQEEYGGGTTAKSAEEQLMGLNEQTAKLQESLTQVVASSGKPFMSMLENISKGASKAADGLAGITESKGFQTLATAGLLGGLAFKTLGMAAGGMYAATSAAAATRMLPRERMASGMAFLGANRGKMMGVGLGAMMLGQMTDSPGMNMTGMAALTAASLLGPGAFRRAEAATRFLTTDAMRVRNLPLNQWLKADIGEPAALRRQMVPTGGPGGGGYYMATASGEQRNLIARAAAQAGMDQKEVQRLRSQMLAVNARGRLTGGEQIATMASRISAAQAAGAPLTAADRGALRTFGSAVEASGQGGAAGRGLYTARNLGATAASMTLGAGGLLMSAPGAMVLGGAALVGGVGYAAYKQNQTADRIEAKLGGESAISEIQKTAAALGQTVPALQSLASAAASVEDAFVGIASALGSSKTGKLTQAQWAGLPTEGKPTHEFTNVQTNTRPWGRRKGRADVEAVAELTSKYGMAGGGEVEALMYADLKKAGLSQEEAEALVTGYRESIGTPGGALKGAVTAYATGGKDLETLVENVGAYRVTQAGKASPQKQADEVVNAILADTTMNDMEKEALLRQMTGEASGGEGPLKGFYTLPEEPGLGAQPRPLAERVAAGRTAPVGGKEPTEGELAVSLLYGDKPLEQRGMLGTWMSAAATQNAIPPGTQPMTSAGEALVSPGEEAATSGGEAFAKAFVGEMRETKPGELIKIESLGAAVAAATATRFGPEKTVTALKEQQYQFGAETSEGKTFAAAAAIAERQQERGYKQLGTLGALKKQQEDAAAGMATAAEAFANGAINVEQANADFAENSAKFTQAKEGQEDWMRSYLKAYKQHTTQLRYEQEDYDRSLRYANEDYATQVEQATAQHQKQMRYMTEDYHLQMKYMAQDYQKQILRSTRQYNLQIERMGEDHAKQLTRNAEAAAKAMYDPFKRMSLEQTWSGAGLLDNMKRQQEAFEGQIANLEKIRELGVSQQAIDLLGLNDPNKAQQLNRIVSDLQGAGGAGMVAGFNEVAAQRQAAAGTLFGAENDIGARQAEEDYKTQLDRMAEDRTQWLADAEEDYKQQRSRADAAFQTSMTRAQEAFDTTMQYMEDAHARSLERMSEAHDTSIDRAAENFAAQFEEIGGEFETLANATKTALEGGVVEWGEIVAGGGETMSTAFANATKDVPADFTAALEKALTDRWGKDSKVAKALGTLFGSLAGSLSPEGGGPGPGESYEPGKGYSGPTEGLLTPTGGRGHIGTGYRVPGDWAAGYHTGVDIPVPTGTPLYSTVHGKVEQTKNDGAEAAYGKHVDIDVDDKDIWLLYGHMSSFGVRVGDTVRPGSYLGRSGATGRVTGPHLHFEVRRGTNDYERDIPPYSWMARGGVVTRPIEAMIGEAGMPEAIIPLDRRGADFVGNFIKRALGDTDLLRAMGGMGQAMPVQISTTNHDHSVSVNGPVTVVSEDPSRVLREIERKARERAMIQPAASGGAR
jgi:murein DD-endopeptidase MepM/ murein hydrolase activator NlpD